MWILTLHNFWKKIHLPVLGLRARLRSPSPVSWAADGHLPTELGGTSMGKKGTLI